MKNDVLEKHWKSKTLLYFRLIFSTGREKKSFVIIILKVQDKV